MTKPEDAESDVDDLADKLVEAALNGDADAFKTVVDHLGDLEEEAPEATEGPNSLPASKAPSITVYRRPNETDAHAVANAAVRPTTLAATAEYGLLSYGRVLHDHLTVDALAEVLREQCKLVTDRNLDRGEAMLAAQAHTLDSIFNVLLKKALIQEHAPHLEMFFKIAMRAQSQCRATWEAVSAIQNPPIAGYVKQANIANNQQINNGPIARADEKSSSPNKLLEQTTHEPDQWLDRGTPREAASGDSEVEAVATVDGTTYVSGQSQGRS